MLLVVNVCMRFDASSHGFGLGTPTPCGVQLATVGYSVTLANSQTAPGAFAASERGVGVSMLEFQPVTSTASPLYSDPIAHALGLDRMLVVNEADLTGQSASDALARLASRPGVAHVEQIFLQSSDSRYLSCEYKLQDNRSAQVVASSAEQAFIARGISASLLNDAGTMEFISERSFDNRSLLQVAFVRRPVVGQDFTYVALLDKATLRVVTLVRANWYELTPA